MTPIDPDRQVELCKALRDKDLAKVKALLQAGAEPHWYRVPIQEATPMEEAISADFLEGLQVLHDAGGSVNDYGLHYTPLLAAAAKRRVEAGRWLLRHGADERLSSSYWDTPMTLALQNEDLAFAEMLLEERPHLRGESLTSAAMAVMGFRDFSVAQWLLKQGMDPNLRIRGREDSPWVQIESGTPWLIVAQTPELTALLLDAGADVNVQDSCGFTALHLAVDNKNEATLLKLLRAGADPDLPNQEGHSPRSLLYAQHETASILSTFKAWEASRRAHESVRTASASSDVSPL